MTRGRKKPVGPSEAREQARVSVLRQRAAILAARPTQVTDSRSMNLLEFSVGNESYAFETTLVSEVYPASDVAIIPGAPDFVLGVVNVRGRIVSVLDLRPLFGAPTVQDYVPSDVIVLRSPSMEFAIAADSISEVREVPYDMVRQSLSALAGIRAEYVLGVTPERVVVLDAEKLLSDPSLVVRHEI